MKKFRKGLTLIEILVVIALISILSSVVIVSNQRSEKNKLTSLSEELFSDIKRVRNMATSRIITASTNDFPLGGYGLIVNNEVGDYKIVAYNDEVLSYPYDANNYDVISTISFDSDFVITDNITSANNIYLRLFSENEFDSDLDKSSEGRYEIKISVDGCTGTCSSFVINIGEETDSGFVLSNIGLKYDEDIYVPPPGSCFLAGTKVLLSDYSRKNIEDVRVGDVVIGYTNGKYVKSKVLELESLSRKGYYIISISNGKELKLTSNHPIYARNTMTKGWASLDPESTYMDNRMKVFELKKMDEVFSIDGWQRVINIKYIEDKVQTYNLKSVEGNTFFAEGVLVHNKEKPSSLGL